MRDLEGPEPMNSSVILEPSRTPLPCLWLVGSMSKGWLHGCHLCVCTEP